METLIMVFGDAAASPTFRQKILSTQIAKCLFGLTEECRNKEVVNTICLNQQNRRKLVRRQGRYRLREWRRYH
jgi:hypothetical protein